MNWITGIQRAIDYVEEHLTEEIDGIINALTAYRDAMAAGDASRLKALLRDGREAKERVDRGSEDKV